MAEYVEYKENEVKQKEPPLHKKIYQIFINGFISGFCFGIAVFALATGHYILFAALMLVSFLGWPTRRKK